MDQARRGLGRWPSSFSKRLSVCPKVFDEGRVGTWYVGQGKKNIDTTRPPLVIQSAREHEPHFFVLNLLNHNLVQLDEIRTVNHSHIPFVARFAHTCSVSNVASSRS
jgi:hypothetical protein